MCWRLVVLTFLLSISFQSHSALVLPQHSSVTYDSIIIQSHEPTQANLKYIVIGVELRGVKVLGKKFLNGNTVFSYDSHYQGDRADLGIRINPKNNSSISKPVTRGRFKQHKHNQGISQYIGGAKWGNSSNVNQYLYGAKANSEQDYIMLHWMYANANDIIKYAVATNKQMSPKAKKGWKTLRDFTRYSYGNVKNNLKILADADAKTPTSIQVKSNQSTTQLENKNKQLTYQVKVLNGRVLNLRDENRKLTSETESMDKGSSRVLSSTYRMHITRKYNSRITELGSLDFDLSNGKISVTDKKTKFMQAYVPTRTVGSFLNNGDFEMLITANFMRKHTSQNRKNMKIKGNLFNLKDIKVEDTYSVYQLGAEISRPKGAPPLASFSISMTDSVKCYNYTTNKFKKTSQNGACFNDSIHVSSSEMTNKTISQVSSKTVGKIIAFNKRIAFLQTKLKNKNEVSTEKTSELIKLRVAASKHENQISFLQTQLKKAQLNPPGGATDIKLKNRNSQLTHEIVSLKEQIMNLNDSLQLNGSHATNIGTIALDFCVSSQLNHIYAVAANGSCIKPYIGMDQSSVIGFAQASGISNVSTQPWTSIKSLTSTQVRSIQRLLVLKGLSASDPDGLLGPKTIKGIQNQLETMGSDHGKKIVRNQLYLEQNTLAQLLTFAQMAEVTSLRNESAQSRDLIIRKDDKIKRISVEINTLRQSSNSQNEGETTAYKQHITRLKTQVTTLQQQVNTGKMVISDNQKETLSKLAETDQVSSNLTKALERATKRNAEIKQLSNELAVAKEKLAQSQPSTLSFTETVSEEWKPLIGDMPLTQRLFCDLYYDFSSKKVEAVKSNNQIRVNMVHRSFQEDLDSLLPGGSLDQWIVKILKVSQVPGGDAAIIAELPCGVLVGSGTMTSNEGSGDQLSWAATIPYSSRLYNELAKVSIGDFVNVSGTFVQIEAFESGRNETFYASNSIGNNPLVSDLGLKKDLYLLDLAYFMMLR